MLNLARFHGGLHLPNNKELSNQAPLRQASIPKKLVYPLMQRQGVTVDPKIQVGERVLRGQVIAYSDHPLATPVHAASSGVIEAIEERLIPHPSGMADLCIVIATDGLDESLVTQGVADFRSQDPASIRTAIKNAGIVGLGGAAFPTSIKLNPGPQRKLDTLLLNGAECEPYITCDDCLMQNQPESVLVGAQILLHSLHIERCIVAIEDHMKRAYARLTQVVAALNDPRIIVVQVPAIYPTGGEKQLIKVVTGKETPSGGIPADIGVLCVNVGTASAVYDAVCNGKPLTERVITVTGRGVKEPQNRYVRIGTPISELIEQCGGYTEHVERLIMGGPMMGFALPDDEIAVVKATNCILAGTAADINTGKQAMPCIRCGDCAKACPVDLLPQQLYWHSRAGNLDKCKEFSLFDCIECGCCEVVCPSHIPLVQYYRSAKSKVIAKAKEAEKAAVAKRRHDMHLERKAKEQAEKAERARLKKEALAKVKQANAEKEGVTQ
ncbi:electron transport complex subunit RsxC [Methylicorpusculum oleiharenae]|uniref:electron transport complex subunit RsxC n=1 Tax=Methylicorpusculum oleiharenae TaxID=1338687 RepID=UPI001359F8AE|nr:electron transport complex subunit RsxC [Methylicorpusculum oleiharenae]MCD2449946.1 electron transport complex subunit RsxC [Methylicorpusculum oleiharenae]